MKLRLYDYSFIFALLVHLGIAILFLKIVLPTKNVNIGFSNIKLIQAYAVSYHLQTSGQITQSNYFRLPMKPWSRIAIIPPKFLTTKFNQANDKSKNNVIGKKIHGNYQPLLILLHDAIASNKVIPQNALYLGERGNVKLQFQLTPGGEIQNIQIIKSSGHQLLDGAAVQTLQAIIPFTPAKKFLHRVTSLTVIIKFG